MFAAAAGATISPSSSSAMASAAPSSRSTSEKTTASSASLQATAPETQSCHGLTLTAMTNAVLMAVSGTLEALAEASKEGPAEGEHVH